MRTSTLCCFALAVLPFASALDSKTITHCTTRYKRGHGTTTLHEPQVTSTVTVNVAPISTLTSTVTGDTMTTYTANLALSTSTVTPPGVTDLFTITSTSFAISAPKVTVTAEALTVTTTSVATSYLPTTTFTTTAYTVLPAGPTTTSIAPVVPAPPTKRSREKRHRDILPQKRKMPPNRKTVKCTPVVQLFSTVTAGTSAATATVEMTVNPTVTSTLTVTGLSIKTIVPAEVDSTVTVATVKTITADTLTVTTTPTFVASTTISIPVLPSATNIVPLVSICDPEKIQKVAIDGFGFEDYANQSQNDFGFEQDEPTCCSLAAGISGAFSYAFRPYNDYYYGPYPGYNPDSTYGECYVGFQGDATSDSCGASSISDVYTSSIYPDSTSAGLLQCGTAFNIIPDD